MNNVTPLFLPGDGYDEIRHADILFRSRDAKDAYRGAYARHVQRGSQYPALLAAFGTLQLIVHEFPAVTSFDKVPDRGAEGVTLLTWNPADIDLCGRCGAPAR